MRQPFDHLTGDRRIDRTRGRIDWVVVRQEDADGYNIARNLEPHINI